MPDGRSRADNQKNRYNPEPEVKQFKQSLRELAEAWGRTTEAWSAMESAGANVPDGRLSATNQMDNPGLLVEGGPKKYPFNESFDDLYHAVLEWVVELENNNDPKAWNISKDVRPLTSSDKHAALVAAHEFRRRSGVAAKKAALAVVSDYEKKKKAITLTNKGIDQQDCYKCGQPIAPGDIVLYGEGGLEQHQQCPAAQPQGWEDRLNLPPHFPREVSPSRRASTKTADLPYGSGEQDPELEANEDAAAGRPTKDTGQSPDDTEVERTAPATEQHQFTHTPAEPLTPPTAPPPMATEPGQETPPAEGESKAEHEEHGANPEMAARAELEAELSDPETIEAVMEFLKEEDSFEGFTVEEGVWNWSEASNFATIKIGNMEFMVAPSSDAAEQLAVAMVKSDLSTQPEIFNKGWLEGFIDEDRLRDILMSDVEEEIRESPDSYGWEPGKVEEEEWEEGLDEVEEEGAVVNKDLLVPPDEVDETEPSNEWVDDKAKEILRDPMKYMRGIYGEEAAKHAIQLVGINEEQAAKDAVDTDGAGHFLSSYDGETHDLPNSGGVYWRHN